MSSIQHAIEHYIGGRRTAGASGRSREVTNPASGQVTGHVALAGVAEVNAAVAAAAAAFPAGPARRRSAARACCSASSNC